MKPDGNISTATRLCAVIGNPVAHSLSPEMHNAAFNTLGLDFVYVSFRVEDLKNAIAGMRALENFRGMSVTIPHKIEIIDYLDEVAEIDRSIGSVNTVINENGKLYGSGTDGPGALKALQDAGVLLDGARILMLGAGGAARAIAFTIARCTHPGRLDILDINTQLLDGLLTDLQKGTETDVAGGGLDPATIAAKAATADLIINCTPVGMHPHEDNTLVPAELFRQGQVVFDVVYNPLETRLLKDAKSRGCKVVSGVEMFINQAVLQFEKFTNVPAPHEIMRQVVMKKLCS